MSGDADDRRAGFDRMGDARARSDNRFGAHGKALQDDSPCSDQRSRFNRDLTGDDGGGIH